MVKRHPVLDCIAQQQTENNNNLKLQAAFKGLGLQWPADAHRALPTPTVDAIAVSRNPSISFLHRDCMSEAPIAQTNDLSLHRWKTVTRMWVTAFVFVGGWRCGA